MNDIDSFDKNISFWDALKENLFSKDWIKNSLGEIVSKDNIDSYIEELDLDSAKEKVEEIFNFSTKNGDKAWQDYFNTLDNGEEYIIDVIKSTDDLSKLTGEDLVAANQKARASVIAHNNALKQQTLGAKAANVAMKGLALAGNMIATWVASEVLSGLYKMSQTSEEVANKAQTLGASFSSTKSELKDYKEQIENLYTTINDSGSSIDEVKNARIQLMSIQDQMIEKYGSEKETVEAITGAIQNETSAWEKLSSAQWKKTKADFNDNGFWSNTSNFFAGYKTNIDRMMDEYGNYSVDIDLTKFNGFKDKDKYDEFKKVLLLTYIFDYF